MCFSLCFWRIVIFLKKCGVVLFWKGKRDLDFISLVAVGGDSCFVCQTFLISSQVRISNIGIFFWDFCYFLCSSDIFNQRDTYGKEKQIWNIFPYFGGVSDEICMYCCEERRGSDVRQWLSTHTGLRELV